MVSRVKYTSTSSQDFVDGDRALDICEEVSFRSPFNEEKPRTGKPHNDNGLSRKPNRVIAIASSMGGIEALKTVVANLPPDFPGAIIIVQHLSPRHKSHLTKILNRYSILPVEEAKEGSMLRAGFIYVTPPDKHLIINKDETLSLSDAPKEHFVRPSAEYTFKSLANSYKQKAIAIVLTGCDGDGKEGVQIIKEMGGKVIAQDRETSQAFSMPENAIKTGCVDLILPIDEIVDGIVNMVFS